MMNDMTSQNKNKKKRNNNNNNKRSGRINDQKKRAE